LISVPLSLFYRYAELEEYTSLSFQPESQCEIVIDKPTIFIKLDAGK